jgi:hypothetical protein
MRARMTKKKTTTIPVDGNIALSPILLFLHICTVTVDSGGTMFCTCKHFEKICLPCIHQACVASLCHDHHINTKTGGKDVFTGFTHHDIDTLVVPIYVLCIPTNDIVHHCPTFPQFGNEPNQMV